MGNKNTFQRLKDDNLLMCFIISNTKNKKIIYVAPYNCLIEYTKTDVTVKTATKSYSSSNIVFITESIIKDIIVCDKLKRDVKKYKKVLFKEIKNHEIRL